MRFQAGYERSFSRDVIWSARSAAAGCSVAKHQAFDPERAHGAPNLGQFSFVICQLLLDQAEELPRPTPHLDQKLSPGDPNR